MIHLLPAKYKKIKFLQIFLFIHFILTSVIVFPLILLSYIFLYNINRKVYKFIVNRCCYVLWIQFNYIAQHWNRLRLKFYVDDATWQYMGQEHAFIIMNHKYDIDWITTWIVAEKIGTLGGGVCFAKSSLKNVPILGWIWQLNGSIFLNRDWEKDRKIIANGLQDFTETFPDYYNMLLLYPEGTRFTHQKMEVGNELARAKGMLELRHCILPRSRGFVEVVRNLRRLGVDTMYDLTIGFPDNDSQAAFTLNNVLNADIKTGSLYCRRVTLKSLPEDDEDLTKWLHEDFQLKDRLFETYIQTGEFPGPHRIIEPSIMGLILYSLSLVLVWLPIGNWLMQGFLVWSWSALLILLLVTIILVIGIQLSMRVTETARGSSYGASSKIAQGHQ